MRRKEFAMARGDALALLERSGTAHFSCQHPGGWPVLRTINPVVIDDWILFHGSPRGEKAECLGQRAVLQCEEVVATIPSYFVDPQRACPATTFFESVQVDGPLEAIEDEAFKAEVLQKLMEKFQPEGGHRPITATDPLYRAAVRGLLITGIRLSQVVGKSKLGQNRPPEQVRQVLVGLWNRGAPGDVAAIRRVREANPTVAPPDFLRGPAGTVFEVALDARNRSEALELLDDQYWTRDFDREALGRAQEGSNAWLGARNPEGRLVATARLISDGARHAWLADVVVDEGYRGRGVGAALIRLALQHPAVRDAKLIRLGTVDAAGFYERLGFVEESRAERSFSPITMVLARG